MSRSTARDVKIQQGSVEVGPLKVVEVVPTET